VKDLTPELQALLDEVVSFEGAERSGHEYRMKRFSHWYKLYRSYRSLKGQYAKAETSRDVGDIMDAARVGFGTELFVPIVYGIIETTLPRMLADNPRLNATPGDPQSEDNVDGMKLLINRQQERTNFPIASQTVAKSGLMYGLGVGKSPWVREMKRSPVLEQRQVPVLDPQTQQPVTEPVQAVQPGPDGQPVPVFENGQPVIIQQPVMTLQWVPSAPVEQVKYEGPKFEPVDVFDFIRESTAYDMATCGRLIHRVWRSEAYCRKMFESGAWTLPEGWELEDALSNGSRSKRDEVWSDRMAAQGYKDAGRSERDIHEVWEYHNDEQKVTLVLDRMVPVAHGDEPYWHGDKPFQIYRPTEVPHEFDGIGEAEAVEDLQLEMNQMRTQRRDNAALVLQRPFAYFDGFLDTDQVKFGAGQMWPVDGPPADLIFPIPLQDIPFSSYREEDGLKADIDRASGLSDSVMGGDDGGAPETATGVQMVHSAAGIRIRSKALRFESETVKEVCRQWVALNQQYIVTEVQIPGPPKPGEGDREFSWYKLGPAELAGTFAIEPEGGSMSPQNEVMRGQEAVQQYQLLRPDPLVDPRKLLLDTLEKLGKRNPDAWLMPEMPMIDPRAMDLLAATLAERFGIDPAEFEALVLEATDEVEQGASDQTFGSVGDQVPESRRGPQGPPPQ
jgi:hypothetical protein